jgi:hypothetical protein
LPRLYRLFSPSIFTEMTGSKSSWSVVTEVTTALWLPFQWRRGDGNAHTGHHFPFPYIAFVENSSTSGGVYQLYLNSYNRRSALSLARCRRWTRFKDESFRHWSTQWDYVFQRQHRWFENRSSPSWNCFKWLIECLVLGFNGADALILDFISTFIHVIKVM